MDPRAFRPRVGFALLLIAGALVGAGTARAAAIGAQGGLDRCGLSGDNGENAQYNAHTGFLVGVQGELGIARAIALSLQPSYVQRVTESTTASTAGQAQGKLTLDYVSVPIVVKFGLGSGRTYVSTGLDLAFLSSAKLSAGGPDRDVKSFLHSTDVGALIGFGVVFPIGHPRLTTELRYVQGLVNVANQQISEWPERFHSYGLQLAAGILFPLGSR
jgi:outer membrane protein with beta-barrel domain